MSVIQSSGDGGIQLATAPLSVAPGTVVVKTGSSASPVSPTSPTTVVIRSSAAAAGGAFAGPQATGQNVVIRSAATSTLSTQSSVVIRSSSVSQQQQQQQVIQPSSPGKITINPSPIVQSRITIGAPVSPPVPILDGVEVNKTETTAATASPVAVVQTGRGSLTIKAASPSPPPTPPVEKGTAVVVEEASDHVQPLANRDPVPTELEPAAESHPSPPTPANNSKEDLSEKVRPKKPAGPSLEEILDKFNISSVFYVVLVVLLAGVLCILGEGEIPLGWILTAISVFSLVAFVALRL